MISIKEEWEAYEAEAFPPDEFSNEARFSLRRAFFRGFHVGFLMQGEMNTAGTEAEFEFYRERLEKDLEDVKGDILLKWQADEGEH
jgi:hypothetical protein